MNVCCISIPSFVMIGSLRPAGLRGILGPMLHRIHYEYANLSGHQIQSIQKIDLWK